MHSHIDLSWKIIMQKPKHEWQHLRRNKNAHLGVGWRRLYFQWQVHWYLPLVKLYHSLGGHFWDTFSPKSWTKLTALVHVINNLLESINSYFWINKKSILNTGSQSIESPLYKLILHAFLLWLHNTLTSPLTRNKSQGFLAIDVILLTIV